MTRLRAILWPMSVLLAYLVGMCIGRAWIIDVYKPKLKTLTVERDAAVKERNDLLKAFTRLVNGDRPEAMVKGQANSGDEGGRK